MNDKDITICRCEEVSQKAIEKAINEEALTIDAVKRATRAGMGLCQGRTCQQLVARLISSKTGKPMGELLPPTSRPPFRPLKLELMANEGGRILKEEEGGD